MDSPMISVEGSHLSCTRHKRYQGILPPRNGCESCMMVFQYEEYARLVEDILQAMNENSPVKLAKCLEKAERI